MENSILTTRSGVAAWFDTTDVSTVAIDTETTGLKYYSLRMIGMSLCNGKKACYIDLNDNPQTEEILTWLRETGMPMISNIVLHHAAFDLSVFHKEGLLVKEFRLFDTKVAAHLIDENRGTGLKELAQRYLKQETMSYKDAISHGASSEEFRQYATNDAIWTWNLHKKFDKKLHELGMTKLFFDVEMPFQYCLMDMRINGVLIDQEALEKLRVEAKRKHLGLAKSLYDRAGWRYTIQPNMLDGSEELVSGHNINSDKQVAELLTETFGMEIPFLTDKGQPSIAKATMKVLAGHPFIDDLAKYRVVEKLLSGFIETCPDFIDGDGKVRPQFWDDGTATGRLSCSEPNLQQIPKVNPGIPFDYKTIFIASPGCTLGNADYSGQELRILAEITKDPRLVRAFMEDYDLHLMTGAALFNLAIPEEEMCTRHPKYEEHKTKYAHERHVGKNGINFPIVYGTTKYGISRNLGITEAEAQGYIDKFYGLYPKVRETIQRCNKQLKHCYHVKTLAGRRRRLNPKFKKSFRQAFNFLIQGLCADMIRCAMVKVRRLGQLNTEWGLKLLLTIHDSIVFEVKDEYVEEAVPRIRHAMETAMKITVPMKVDISTGKNYSEAK